jgi:signal transduction histidine kinase
MINSDPDWESEVEVQAQPDLQFSSTNQPVDAFLAMLGNEMRNPLSALRGALQRWEGCRHDPAEMDELREVMQRQVRQLVRLSDDLLDLARLKQGRLEIRRDPVELGELVRAACDELRPYIEERGHTLLLSVPPEALVVHGDSSRLLQAIANLIQNAAKFTDRNGVLDVSLSAEDGMAVIRIHDNGRGIEERMLKAIFEPQSPVDPIDEVPEDGLGIGLRLVKAVVEHHGGSVAANSGGAGLGSEFVVRLPLSASSASLRTAQPQPTRELM